MVEERRSRSDRLRSILRKQPWFVWLDGGIGVWLVLSPFLLPGPPIESVDDILVGLLLIGIGVVNAYRLSRVGRISLLSLQFGALLALWLIAFSIDFARGTILLVDNLVAGSIVLVVHLVSYRHRRLAGR